jgi:hypothetical protein
LFKQGSGLTHADVRALASRELPVVVGDEVLVLQIPEGHTAPGGNFWARGVCVRSVDDGASTTFCVQPLVITGHGRRACFPEKDVEAARIRHAHSVICTEQHARQASGLGQDRFPGARADQIQHEELWTRTTAQRNDITAKFIRDKSVVAMADGGASTARAGVKWMLKEGIPTLLERLNKLLVEAGQTPSSEAHFRALVGGREYTKLTAEKCCCATCRDLGFVVYEVLREVVRDLCAIASNKLDTKKLEGRLIDEINAEERFRAGAFRAHLKEASPCDRHCLRYLLTSENEPEFHVDCTHGRSDERVLDEPPTMEESAGPGEVESSAWEDECCFCYASYEENTALLTCLRVLPARGAQEVHP